MLSVGVMSPSGYGRETTSILACFKFRDLNLVVVARVVLSMTMRTGVVGFVGFWWLMTSSLVVIRKTHTHARTHMHTHARTHTTHARTRTHTHAHTPHTHARAHTHACTHATANRHTHTHPQQPYNSDRKENQLNRPNKHFNHFF